MYLFIKMYKNLPTQIYLILADHAQLRFSVSWGGGGSGLIKGVKYVQYNYTILSGGREYSFQITKIAKCQQFCIFYALN